MCRGAKREVRGWMLAIFVLLSFAPLVACDVPQAAPPSPPSIDDVTMTRSIDQKTKEPTDPTTTFKSSDTTIYAVAKVSNLVDGSKVMAKWYYKNVEIPEVRGTMALVGRYGSGYLSFSVVASEPLQVGDWKVEIYLDDELAKTATFQVVR